MVMWLSLTPALPTPPAFLGWDKLHHFLAYAWLMYWFRQVFFRWPWFWPAFLTLLGIGLEFLKGWSGRRFFEFYDMVANTLGVFGGLTVAMTPAGRLIMQLDRFWSKSFLSPAYGKSRLRVGAEESTQSSTDVKHHSQGDF